MAPKSPELYNLKTTAIYFAAASILLLLGLVGMVLQDSIRDWKGYQREFIDYSREKTQKEIETARAKIDQNKLKQLHTEFETAQIQIKAHQQEIKQLEKEVTRLELECKKTRTAYQDLKQVQDSDRYFFEDDREHHKQHEAAQYEARLKLQEPKLTDLKLKVEQAEASRDETQAQLDKFLAAQKNADAEMAKLTLDVTRFEKKFESLKPNFFKSLLDAPMLDFLKPSLRIQQVVLENLEDDFYFVRAKKVDRCITCHLGIDQKGLEGAPVPFKSHPRLDLFVSADSPHPVETFGCTVCHGGSGHSANFVTTAHTPHDEKQKKEWEKKYAWKEMEHAPEKMISLKHAEASCAKCHNGVVDVPQAPKLNEGRRLAETFGCFNCHKVAGVERWKVGPSLLNVQSKLEQDWIVRWLKNPKEFRPSTKMPRVFHLSNTSDEASVEKSAVAIAGIATYLIKNSGSVSLLSPPVKGDPEKGKKQMEALGCLGCHTANGKAANNHGPELSNLGSKVTPDWLYTWLKDPKHYSPSTRMPSLRLSNEEASNITRYLLTQRDQNFESSRLPHIKAENVDDLALTFLSGEMRRADARKQLDQMNQEQRLEYIGKKSISHQGCFSCHAIKGFETTKPIGTELTEEGSKDVRKLDFGFVHLEHDRASWFFQKLKEPRIFDEGKDKTYHDKLRMPQFDMTDEQAQSLTTFLLSLQKAHIPQEMHKNLNLKEAQVEEGRLLVRKLNCQGCHTVDGVEGRIRSITEDLGKAPPVINGEGKKVQPQWLFQFLHEPAAIRPWLNVRMPTFDFSDTELTTLVDYFQNLDHVPPSYNTSHAKPPAEMMAAGHELFQKFQCIKCHKAEPQPGLSASFLAPNLLMAKSRLRPEWVVEWLKDPQILQEGTMMPTFFAEKQSPLPDVLGGDYVKQSEALRDYLWEFTPEEARIIEQPAPSKAAAKTVT
ncbi:MAG: c-type cytochrome [Candidatus Omnitrophica bacterium]|nr:c-type cytochrome [Candidatus Omnitrophota bacterium]